MVEQNKRLIREYLEKLSGNPKPNWLVDQYVSDKDMELKKHIEVFEASFPNYELNIEDIIAENDKVVVRFDFVGTHLGEFMEFPPSGKKINIKGILIYQVADNKIVNHWMTVNMLDLIQQLEPEKAEIV